MASQAVIVIPEFRIHKFWRYDHDRTMVSTILTNGNDETAEINKIE